MTLKERVCEIDMVLTTKTALGGYSKKHKFVTLNEVTGKALVSIAGPLKNDAKISKALLKIFGLKLPNVGSSATSSDGKTTLLGLQSDQVFMLFNYVGDNAVTLVATKLGNAGYYTDQSDSWAMIEISGVGALSALERICMIDLHKKTFPVGSVARTTMEHLGTIIFKQGEDKYMVMGARSSANSLLHALEVSIHNTS